MSQMKGQDKTPDKQLNEVEIGKLPEKEFIIMIVNLIQEPRKGMEARFRRSSNVYQTPVTIKKEQRQMIE